MRDYCFTSESVSEGHPDKLADQISDGILDEIIGQDPKARVACETMVNTGMAVVAGEISTNCYVEIPQIVRKVVEDVGYNSDVVGFDHKTCAVLSSIDRQSPDIALGVDAETSASNEQGAGDQGIMFGYADNETAELMPLTISYAHKLVYELSQLRKSGKLPFLCPDSKSQVTVEYQDGKAKRIDAVVVSTQHKEDVTIDQLRQAIREELIDKVLPREWVDDKTKYYINPTGRFVYGGPLADCGLTGRKIIVDTYGGHGAHGGGAFSGKDPSKVDRSAAYAARHVAKNIVAAGLADKCLVQLSYAIGIAQPLSINVNDYGTGNASPEVLEKAVRELWDLRPTSIIKNYELLNPIFRKTSNYGHFGREDQGFKWELKDRADALKDVVKTLSK
jgi:S-adenosylmethionine synthetase